MPTRFRTNAKSWQYPPYPTGALSQSAGNSVPTVATANATGDINNPGTNVVNYSSGADWNGQNGNMTTVGSAGPLGDSFYGTSDQGGNVFEWNETVVGGSFRVLRGGSWFHGGSVLGPQFQGTFGNPSDDGTAIGFRVASPVSEAAIPTVSQWGLAAMTLLVLVGGTLLIAGRRPVPA